MRRRREFAYPSVSNLHWLREARFELEDVDDPVAIPEDG
jgi:hypothetical protein